MQTNKPLPHLTIRSGPWAGTMVRFATVEQLRAVQESARLYAKDTGWILGITLEKSPVLPSLNAPQPKESNTK